MHHLLLNDRILWEDGSITVPSDIISNFIHIADEGKLYTDELNSDIVEFNRMCSPDNRIKIKKELDEMSRDWVIPDDIKSINLKKHLNMLLLEELESGNFSDDECIERAERLDYEYTELINAGLSDLIYTILYVINRFEDNNVVWGVGRGSSTSSYLLYILGIHDVDSVEYDLDFSEFLH